MPEPLVTVVIPVYNGSAFLEDSVRSATSQTYRNLQIVVVNDGSTDATPEVAERLRREDPRIEVVHQENRGLSGARNSGIAAARGEFINFLDADDWLLPHKIRLHVDSLMENPQFELVYSDYVIRSEDGEHHLRLGPLPLPAADLLMYRSWFAPMVPLLRKTLVDEVGDFDTTMRTTEDRDYWYRCALRTEFLYVPGDVAAYRVHPNQMSKDRAGMRTGHSQFADKHFSHDKRRHRSCWALHYLFEARHSRAVGRHADALKYLARFVRTVNSPSEAKLIWRISR